MSDHKMDTDQRKHVKDIRKPYVPPMIKDLLELTASGQGPIPLQACDPTGGVGNTPCAPGG